MAYHTEMLFLEIFNMYELVTGEKEIPYDNLESAFYTFQDILNTKEGLDYANVFEEELDRLMDSLPDDFSITDTEVKMEQDIDEIFNDFMNKFPTLNEIDCDLQEYVQNLGIYKALDIDIPLEDTKEYFILNQNIIKLYIYLAKRDFEGKDLRGSILYLKSFTDRLKDLISNIDTEMLQKIKMCVTYKNGIYLADGEENFQNSNWKIILFKSLNEQLKSLNYDKLEYLSCTRNNELINDSDNIIYEYFEADEDEEEIQEDREEFEEIPLLLTDFLIYLNEFILKTRSELPKEVLENLLIKKYLLISTPEQSKLEEYFLENGTLDGLTIPPVTPGFFNENSFQLIKPTVIECALSLDYNDYEINAKPYLYAKIVTNAIFIKCYLNLVVNTNDKNDIIDLLVNNRFYKDKNYSLITNILDSIIFTQNYDRER